MHQFIQENRPSLASRDPFLRYEYQQVREQWDHHQQLKQQTQRMKQGLAALPELEQHKAVLSERMKEVEVRREEVSKEAKALAGEEKEIEGIVAQLKQGHAWVTLASLSRQISEAEAELASVQEEIQQNRSWLDRLLRRNDGGDS